MNGRSHHTNGLRGLEYCSCRSIYTIHRVSLLTGGDDCEYELNKVEEVEEDYEGEGANGGEENNVPAIEIVDTWRREGER